MSRSTVEQVWEAHGLQCAVLVMDWGHRCGYVCVPEDHPWHGKGYSETVPTVPVDAAEYEVEKDLGIISAFCYGLSDDEDRENYARTPEFQIAVHGGLTYAGAKPGNCPRGWWFGFDTAHADDSPADWPLERMVEETERVAEQLSAIAAFPVTP